MLALYIIAFDVVSVKTNKIETLTRSFWRHSSHPVKSIFFYGVWMILTFHLIFEPKVRNAVYGKK